MTQVTTGTRGVLSLPIVYELWSRIVGGEHGRSIFVREHARPGANARVLDLGCGTGELLNHLPKSVSYIGIDISPEYIARANTRLRTHAEFRVGDATIIDYDGPDNFDLVIAFGVLHHLDDTQVGALFTNAIDKLAPRGRTVTVDPVFAPGQSRVARMLMRRDRGQHVRTQEAYVALADPIFRSVQSSVYHNLLRIPYSHCVLECENPAVGTR
jgi:SAM-dependent methyltransferase